MPKYRHQPGGRSDENIGDLNIDAVFSRLTVDEHNDYVKENFSELIVETEGVIAGLARLSIKHLNKIPSIKSSEKFENIRRNEKPVDSKLDYSKRKLSNGRFITSAELCRWRRDTWLPKRRGIVQVILEMPETGTKLPKLDSVGVSMAGLAVIGFGNMPVNISDWLLQVSEKNWLNFADKIAKSYDELRETYVQRYAGALAAACLFKEGMKKGFSFNYDTSDLTELYFEWQSKSNMEDMVSLDPEVGELVGVPFEQGNSFDDKKSPTRIIGHPPCILLELTKQESSD